MREDWPQVIKDVGFDFSWDEKKVWALEEPVTEMNISDLEWHFDVPFLRENGSYNLKPRSVIEEPKKHPEEYRRTMAADLSHPIDVMENKGRWLILDGLHRLMKASMQGLEKVQVRKIPRSRIPEILKRPESASDKPNEYAREYYDRLGGSLPGEYSHDRWFSSPPARLDYRETRRSLERALEGHKPGSVLEVGCGDGMWTPMLAERAERVRAIEQSEEMLKRARKRLEKLTDVAFEQADFQAAVPEPKHDLVASVRAFEYFGDKAQAASNFLDFLKPGGTLILVAKNARRAQRDLAPGSEELHDRETGRAETVRILEEAGFEVLRAYPAIVKWKPGASFLFRFACEALHALCLAASRLFRIVDPFPGITESYVYIGRKKSSHPLAEIMGPKA